MNSSVVVKAPLTAASTSVAFRVLAAVAILHVVLSLVVFPIAASRLDASYNQNEFTDGYDLLAANLASGHGYRFYPDTAPTMMREPGYPLFLVGIQSIFGSSFTVVRCANLLLTLLTAFLTFHIARRFFPAQPALPLAAAALFLVHPGVLIAENRGGVELLFTFLLASFVLAFARALESRADLHFVLAGFLLGVTVLVRSTPMLFPLLFAPVLFFKSAGGAGKLRAVRQIAWTVLAMTLVLSPWIVRNYRLVGRIVPSASVLGVSTQAGQYINEHLFEGRSFWTLDREASRIRDQEAIRMGLPFEGDASSYYQVFYHPQDEVHFSDALLHKTMEKYKEHPGLYVRVAAQNFVNFWVAGKTWAATAFNASLQLPLLAFAAVGAFLVLKRRSGHFLPMILVLMGGIIAIHVGVLAQARYSIPFQPFITALACGGAFHLWARSVRPAAL